MVIQTPAMQLFNYPTTIVYIFIQATNNTTTLYTCKYYSCVKKSTFLYIFISKILHIGFILLRKYCYANIEVRKMKIRGCCNVLKSRCISINLYLVEKIGKFPMGRRSTEDIILSQHKWHVVSAMLQSLQGHMDEASHTRAKHHWRKLLLRRLLRTSSNLTESLHQFVRKEIFFIYFCRSCFATYFGIKF